jgi:hypothetical protein
MANETTSINNKYIVVITNGFVFIGDVMDENDKYLRIENASCIRTWGTTNGLGQLALTGPTAQTVLDPAGVVEVAWPAVIMKIKCQV